VIASIPRGPVEVPDVVASVAGGAPLVPLWRNELGGLTFRIDTPTPRVIKWSPNAEPELDLRPEIERLAWAGRYTTVARVLEHGGDERGHWVLLSALPGETAVSDRWRADSRTAVTAGGRGLRALHDRLPVDDCPFDWSVAMRIEAHHRFGVDERGRARLAALGPPPPTDRLVVCHGDACAPNTLLDGAGRWVAHVDLGDLGVADRWADLAVATWSTHWNYGPGWEGALLDAYGIAPDQQRTAYYRRLWDPGTEALTI